MSRIGTIRVAWKVVGEDLKEAMIKNDLKSFQKFVGGDIQPLRVTDDGIYIMCNEDGRATQILNAKISARMPDLSHLKPHFIINTTGRELPAPGEIGFHEIYGNFLFTRIDEDGDCIGLTDEDLKRLLA